MSYSYAEVFPYLFTMSWAQDLRCIFAQEQEMYDDDTYDQEYDYYIEETISEHSWQTIEVKIPAFKGIHWHTKEEKEFEAKTFYIKTTFVKDIIHDSSDSSTTYTKKYELTDTKSKEVFMLELYYYSSDYPHLTSITITPVVVKPKVMKAKKVKTQFVIIEAVKKGYMIHGIFNNLEKAVDSIEQLVKSNSLLSDVTKCVIEEIPENTPLIYQPEETDSKFFLRSAINQYKQFDKMN